MPTKRELQEAADWARANLSTPPTQEPLQIKQAVLNNISQNPLPVGGADEPGTPLSFDAMDKYRTAQLNMLAGSPQTPEENMSDYTDVPKPRFANLQQKFGPQQNDQSQSSDMRNTLQGSQEVTPELLKKLGYNDEDEE